MRQCCFLLYLFSHEVFSGPGAKLLAVTFPGIAGRVLIKTCLSTPYSISAYAIVLQNLVMTKPSVCFLYVTERNHKCYS